MSAAPREPPTGLAYDSTTVDRIGEKQFLRTLVENTSDGLLTIDETSTVICANPAISDIFGYDPEELVGTSLLTLIPPQLRDQHIQAISHYLATGERNLDWDRIELPGLHKDGYVIELAISFREHIENGQHLFTGIIHEITEQKERERQLERYETIVETVGDAVYQLDREGRFVTVNDVVVEVTGYSRNELIGEPVTKVLNEEDIQKSLEAIQQLIDDKERDVGVVEMEIKTATGDVIPVEDRIALLHSDGELVGTVGVVRDITNRKQAEAERRLLHTTIQSAAEAETFINGLDIVIKDVCDETDWDYGEAWIPSEEGDYLERTSAAHVVSEEFQPFKDISEITSFGPTEGLPGHVWASKEAEWMPDVSALSEEVFPRVEAAMTVGLGAALGVPILYEEEVVAVLAFYMDEERDIDERLVEIVSSVAVELGGLLDRRRKEDAIREHEQELERQRNELAELNRINAVIREINQTLVEASARQEIERTVCERLASSDSYVFAWIGEEHPSEKSVEPRIWAGDDDDIIQGFTAADVKTAYAPSGEAVQSGTVQVTQNILEDAEYESWWEHAQEQGYQSSAAVPIVYRDTVYGVLHLYTDRQYGFTDREIEVLKELGETIGLATNSVESTKLLHSDVATELQFHITDTDSFFTEVSRQLECTIELEGVVPGGDNRYLYYITVAGTDSEAVRDMAAGEEHVHDVRVLSDHSEESLLQVEVGGSSAVMALIEAGARIITAVADNGESTVVVHISPETEPGTIVDTVQRLFPKSELTGKREIHRPVQTKTEFRESVKDRLTDKQRRALEAAFRGGYFDRPRTIKGSELAESFDVAPSTFHFHIQTGLNKVLGAVFDDSVTE